MSMKMRKKLLVPLLSLSLLLPTVPSITSAATVVEQATVHSKAVELRVSLDHLLSEHFVLAVAAMTKAHDGSSDASNAYQALDQNALDMEPAIASLYGTEAAAKFTQIFRAHNKATDDLVKGMKAGNTQAVADAKAQVQNFIVDFSKLLATATSGMLPEQAAQDAVRKHEQQVQLTFDRYVAGDYSGALQTYREGFKEMFAISKALSTAITKQMPAKFDNSTPDTLAAELRSTLNRLASEHLALSITQMQKELDNGKDASAWVQAEASNTADFKAAIASVYGADGADKFVRIWTMNHINAQSEIVKAVKSGNSTALTESKQKINQFVTEFGAFLGSATEGKLPEGVAQESIRKHEDQVQLAFDQYSAKMYDTAYKTMREGYKFMFSVGEALSSAIVAQKNAMFQVPKVEPKLTSIWMHIESKDITVDTQTTMMDTVPTLIDGKLFLPLRYVYEAMGAKVYWYEQNQSIVVEFGADLQTFWVGKDLMDHNGDQKVVGSVVSINQDGRAVLPAEFVAKSLNWELTRKQGDPEIKLTKIQ